MVEELVREFVPEALAAGLDFSRLQRVNPKFHSARGAARRREGDVIWRLPTCEGADIYLYLLLEFQSESDWWMAVRTQVYQGLLWQQVIDEKKLQTGARLPPLLLLVLYNGVRRWNAATDIRELIALSPDSALWPWQPQVRYYLLDMGAFPTDELARRASLVALLFRLEHQLPLEEFDRALDDVIGWFRHHEGSERLRELFAELVREAFTRRGINVLASEELLNMKPNLEMTIASWQKQWLADATAQGLSQGLSQGISQGLAQGLTQGLAQGLTQGKTEAKAEGLIWLLDQRFGLVAPSLRKRIHRAKLATLDRWFKLAIAAPDLRSVFARQTGS